MCAYVLRPCPARWSRISGSRKIVTIPVQFARDTDYQLTIFHAHSIEGGQLPAMVRQSFSRSRVRR